MGARSSLRRSASCAQIATGLGRRRGGRRHRSSWPIPARLGVAAVLRSPAPFSSSSVSATERGNIEKADPAVKEGGHADLIGRVHRRRRAAAGAQGARARWRRAGKRISSGASKVSWPMAARSSVGAGQAQPVRPGPGAGDRRAHVRRPELGQGRAVGVLDQAVDDRLRVDQHVDPLRRHVEQVGGLDHLQALVHHGGRIRPKSWRPCSSSGARRPARGVAPAIASRRPAAERAARGGEDQPARPGRRQAGLQHLEDRRVLGIHRDHQPAGGLGDGQQRRPGADQALLVGQRDDRAGCAPPPAWARGPRRRRWPTSPSRRPCPAASTIAAGAAGARRRRSRSAGRAARAAASRPRSPPAAAASCSACSASGATLRPAVSARISTVGAGLRRAGRASRRRPSRSSPGSVTRARRHQCAQP